MPISVPRRRAVLAVAFAMLATTGAVAQKAPPDAARLAAAKELMVVAGSAQQFDAVMPLIMRQMVDIFAGLRPQHRGEIESVMQCLMTKFSDRKQELIDQIAVLDTEKLANEDITGLIAFYKTPVGQKFVGIQPELAQQSMILGQRWGQKLGAEVDVELRKELKKRGIDL